MFQRCTLNTGLTVHVKSVTITTKVLSLNPIHGDVYSTRYNIMWFSPVISVSSTNKTDRHDITEILLKVALNTIQHKTNLIEITYF